MPAFTKPMGGRSGASDYRSELGRYMRDARTAAGMTQAELAAKLGMAYYTSISAIEVGRNVVPPERYLEFAEALNIPPAEFAQRVLELTNPWMHAMLFDANPKARIKRISEGLGNRLGQEPQDPRYRRERN